jgi:signal transduction histidine kinase
MGVFERIYRWLSHSLANQLLFTYLLVLTIALAMVCFWALFLIKTESINDLRNALEVEAVNLGLEIDNDLALDSTETRRRIKAAADRHASKLGLSITVVDNDGHVLADSGTNLHDEGENISNQPEINDALAGIAAIYTRNSPRTKQDWLFVAYPVRAAGDTAGVIRVGVPLTELNQRLHKDLIIFLELIFATGVVTVAISLWLAKRVTKPIRDMSAMANQIAKSGDLSEFVPVSRWDEIGELGLSFNQMIGRLRDQERTRQEFIANASHELKTPTMAIGSVVEALQAGAADDPDLRHQFLGSLERLVDRQVILLKDLLDITRLDGGLETQWQEQCDLSTVLHETAEQVRPQAEKKGITFAVPDANGIIINGNGSQLQRALVNLLTNAVNYTQPEGTVTVSTKFTEPAQVEIRIQDTGQGIDAADLPHIFERFYRGDKARTRSGGGTGLGLAITREIIARHHGTVDVESTVGKGSTFTVRLPASIKKTTQQLPAIPAPAAPTESEAEVATT